MKVGSDVSGSRSIDSRWEHHTNRVPIRVVWLDDVFLEMLGPAVFNVDVEGHEVPVLRGMEQILSRIDYRVLCEHGLESLQALLDRVRVHRVARQSMELVPLEISELVASGDAYAKDVILARSMGELGLVHESVHSATCPGEPRGVPGEGDH